MMSEIYLFHFSKKKWGGYDMMSEIYLFHFSKNTFCGKIKLTTKQLVNFKKNSCQFRLNVGFYFIYKRLFYFPSSHINI